MSAAETATRVRVRRDGAVGFTWTAHCTDPSCGPVTHILPAIGGVGVNTRIGNRTQPLALAAACHHLRKCHA